MYFVLLTYGFYVTGKVLMQLADKKPSVAHKGLAKPVVLGAFFALASLACYSTEGVALASGAATLLQFALLLSANYAACWALGSRH